jgi:hypothetical protein
LLIPGKERGIRRFCLWAIGLAVLTLQKINQNPKFTAGVQVKVSRKAVALTRISTDLVLRNDWMLRQLFAQAARGLPLVRIGETRRPYPAHVIEAAPMAAPAPVAGPERASRRSYGGSAT